MSVRAKFARIKFHENYYFWTVLRMTGTYQECIIRFLGGQEVFRKKKSFIMRVEKTKQKIAPPVRGKKRKKEINPQATEKKQNKQNKTKTKTKKKNTILRADGPPKQGRSDGTFFFSNIFFLFFFLSGGKKSPPLKKHKNVQIFLDFGRKQQISHDFSKKEKKNSQNGKSGFSFFGKSKFPPPPWKSYGTSLLLINFFHSFFLQEMQLMTLDGCMFSISPCFTAPTSKLRRPSREMMKGNRTNCCNRHADHDVKIQDCSLLGQPLFVGRQLYFICHAVWMYVTMYRCMSDLDNKKINLRQNAMTDFHKTWYEGSGRHKCYPRCLSSPNAPIKQLLCIFVLIG